MPSDIIRNVTIAGATGRVGLAIATALAATNNHNLTALTRPGSDTSSLPHTIKIVTVDYTSIPSLTTALHNTAFLIITMSAFTGSTPETNLISAAAAAGVRHVMPNHYGQDPRHAALATDIPALAHKTAVFASVRASGLSCIPLACGFWYQWSLAGGHGACFGIDVAARRATLYDDGRTAISSSSWAQCGAAVAGLLALPEDGASPCVRDWASRAALRVNSFQVSQREMLDSVHRVLGTTDADWEIAYQSAEERFKEGCEEFERGDRKGFSKLLYARAFYKDGAGDLTSWGELDNEKIGLKPGDLDAETREAIRMVDSGWEQFPAAKK